MLGALLQLHSSAAHRNTNSSYLAILVVLSRDGCKWMYHLFVTSPPGGADSGCDCDGYRPDTLGGEIGSDLFLLYILLHLQRGSVRS